MPVASEAARILDFLFRAGGVDGIVVSKGYCTGGDRQVGERERGVRIRVGAGGGACFIAPSLFEVRGERSGRLLAT